MPYAYIILGLGMSSAKCHSRNTSDECASEQCNHPDSPSVHFVPDINYNLYAFTIHHLLNDKTFVYLFE